MHGENIPTICRTCQRQIVGVGRKLCSATVLEIVAGNVKCNLEMCDGNQAVSMDFCGFDLAFMPALRRRGSFFGSVGTRSPSLIA